MTRVASVAVAFAGVVHLILAPQHFEHAPAHGLFFAVAGVAEIVWALLFLRNPSDRMYYVGIVMAGALVVIWAATRIIPAPFHGHVEPIDLGGIVCKISELIGIVALVSLAAGGKVVGLAKRSFAGFMAEALILAGFFGFGFYMVAHQVEPYMPFLGGQAHSEHAEGEDHTHEEGEDHDHEEGEEHDE
jgi:hypothetical protein